MKVQQVKQLKIPLLGFLGLGLYSTLHPLGSTLPHRLKHCCFDLESNISQYVPWIGCGYDWECVLKAYITCMICDTPASLPSPPNAKSLPAKMFVVVMIYLWFCWCLTLQEVYREGSSSTCQRSSLSLLLVRQAYPWSWWWLWWLLLRLHW